MGEKLEIPKEDQWELAVDGLWKGEEKVKTHIMNLKSLTEDAIRRVKRLEMKEELQPEIKRTVACILCDATDHSVYKCPMNELAKKAAKGPKAVHEILSEGALNKSNEHLYFGLKAFIPLLNTGA